MKNMDIIAMARELGKAIQQDELYISLNAAKQLNDEDEALQELIGKFNLIMAELDHESEKADHNDEKIEEYNDQLQNAYNEIMSNVNMARFNAAKEKMDEKMNEVVAILAAAVNGEDPMTFDPNAHHDCGGDCSCCHGCD